MQVRTREAQRQQEEDDRHDPRPRRRRHAGRRRARERVAGADAGEDEGRDQERDDEQVRADRLEQRFTPAGRVQPRQLALGDPDAQRHHDGHREAAHPGDHGDREHLHDEQGHAVRVEAHVRGEEHARQTGRERAERPARRRHPVGIDAAEHGERAVVDDGAQLRADAGPARDGTDPYGQRDGHRQLPPRIRRHQRRRVRPCPGAPHQGGPADQQDEDADGRDERLRGVTAEDGQRPEDETLQGHTDRRGHKEQRHRGAEPQRPAPFDRELAQQICADHRDRAVREVEYAGRPVGDDQPDPGQGGGAAHRETGEGEVVRQ